LAQGLKEVNVDVDETDIRQDMEVISSDGQRVGVVDRVEGGSIKLTKYGSASEGLDHSIPLGWVKAVDWAVYLSKTCEEAQREWEASAPGRGG
jgi:hypothetical protein